MTVLAECPSIPPPALLLSSAAGKVLTSGSGDNPYRNPPTCDPDRPEPLHDLTPVLKRSALPALERSPPFASVAAPAGYMASDAPQDSLPMNMSATSFPDSPSGSGGQSGASRQRPPPQPLPSAQPRRQPPLRPPFHHAPSSSSSGQDTSSNPPGPGPPNTYPGPSPYASAPSSFGHRSSFVGPQYTMSHHQPPMSMMHSPPPYAFSHHRSMHDSSIPHIPYTSASLVPMLHAPMYPSYTQSDQTSNPQHLFSTSAPPPQHSLYAQVPIAPSPRPRSPLPPAQNSSGPHPGPRISTSFGAQPSYGYSTPHQYPYGAPHSYAPSPTMYSPTYPSPYPQPYGGASSEQERQQGTWWYLPPGVPSSSNTYENTRPSFQSPYNMGYPALNRREGEGYAQGPSNLPTARSPASPRRPPAQSSQVGGSQASMREDPLSPISAARSSPKPPNLSRAISTLSEPERAQGRQSYHPNPPAHRSEWVMWAGNVPSDATHDELWRFFNQSLPRPSPSIDPDTATSSVQTRSADETYGGVSSIFLISRSNCAFVNFETEKHLQSATTRFNGQPIRPNDPRCPRLVCRVRKRTDDLKAGVGGQRGIGMHTKWVEEQKAKTKTPRVRREAGSSTFPEESVSSPDEEMAGRYRGLSVSDDESGRRQVGSHTDSSGSFASTNSSFLVKNFPQRYFILKSLTQHDLDLSVQRGVWATQRHNEGILDQAFRTSQDVYLIFGVNKSGEFYGYARMASGISQSEDRIPWETPSHSSSSQKGSSQRKPGSGFILSPREHRFTDSSPQPVSTSQENPSVPPSAPSSGAMLSVPPQRLGRSIPDTPAGQVLSAPAEMVEPHRHLTHRTPVPGLSLNVAPVTAVPAAHDTFELDTMAPYKAIRQPSEGPSEPIPPAEIRKEQLLPVTEEPAGSEDPVTPAAGDAPQQGEEEQSPKEVWGHSFRVEWIKTERLPFYRTRHIRNPWNHGREVKVSRDGTELEPLVGKELLEEWNRPTASPPTSPPPPQRPPSQKRPRPSSAAAAAATTLRAS